MKNSIWPLLAVLILAGVGGIAWYLHSQQQEAAAPAPKAQPAPAPAAAPESHYPVEEPPAAAPPKPLPKLEQSDEQALEALAGLFGPQSLAELFQPKDLIRRIVATVDNLPRERVAGRLMAIRPVPGHFAAAGVEGGRSLSAENYARYTPWVHAAQAVDAKALATVYAHFYPLFQQAYVELGYPDGYFNDRLVKVIDDLLATPTPAQPVRLTQPSVLFHYADPELESLSAGQKMLIRMGPDNAAIVKDKLREVRVQVTTQVHRK